MKWGSGASPRIARRSGISTGRSTSVAELAVEFGEPKQLLLSKVSSSLTLLGARIRTKEGD
jgi:hypothetical protein